MNLVTNGYPVSISKKFAMILQREIDHATIDPQEPLVLNFRDPDYGPETGGFHPVEVMITHGRIQYITDFAYYGSGPFAELAKDLDFDFGSGLFQQQGRDYPIHQGRALYRLFQQNFCAYYQMGTYEVEVSNV